ncbi:hypothetical protein NECAME_04367 [Necator americanus]|uniref:Uncharacterized protein n=1 Tax=Necator americanus TaxID=51031 RepID=W2STH4_NECAM|nr:hypothetical protein NECAME_04367 [Necator americanus]ETN73059.1 hypothetical protein NECAME_04367 [Necator americanus]
MERKEATPPLDWKPSDVAYYLLDLKTGILTSGFSILDIPGQYPHQLTADALADILTTHTDTRIR